MPAYEYICENCKNDFVVTMRLREADKKQVKCPNCGSDNITRKYNVEFTAVTSKKS